MSYENETGWVRDINDLKSIIKYSIEHKNEYASEDIKQIKLGLIIALDLLKRDSNQIISCYYVKLIGYKILNSLYRRQGIDTYEESINKTISLLKSAIEDTKFEKETYKQLKKNVRGHSDDEQEYMIPILDLIEYIKESGKKRDKDADVCVDILDQLLGIKKHNEERYTVADYTDYDSEKYREKSKATLSLLK